MGNFVDRRLDGLDFAHALLNGDPVLNRREVAFSAAGNVFKGNRGGRLLFQSFKKGSVVLHAAGKLINDNVRKLLAVGLGDVKDTHHLECGTHHFHSLRNGLSVCIQHRLLRGRINFFPLFLCLVGRGSEYLDAFLSLHDLTVKVALP